jgi:hypothetical protein
MLKKPSPKKFQARKQAIQEAIDAAITQHLPEANTAPRRDPRNTQFGTPAAHSWTDQWLETVNQRATQCQHPICGARTPAGTPCTAKPTHENGRCPHHGGFDLTGAPKDNRNAVLHGLYSRRIQTCGPHCPMFASCPLGQNRPGGPVTDMPKHERPRCPYEQAEYNATLNDAILRANFTRPGDPMALHFAHDIATLRVMCSRSLATLANTPLIETTQAQSDNHAPSNKPATALTAYLRISSELRRYCNMLEEASPAQGDSGIQTVLTQTQCQQNDTSIHPDDQAHPQPMTGPRYQAVRSAMRDAHFHARNGHDDKILHYLNLALQLNPQYAAAQRDDLLQAYHFYE